MTSKPVRLSGRRRGMAGLIVLGVTAVLLATGYALLRNGSDAMARAVGVPSMAPPVLELPVQALEPQPTKARQHAFHGVSSCVLASINGHNYQTTFSVEHGTTIGLGGWLIDKVDGTVPQQAWIVLARSGGDSPVFQSPIEFHEKRPDVTEYFGNKHDYDNSGFIAEISTRALPAGDYHLYIVFDANGTFYTCDNGRYLTVLEPAHHMDATK